MALLLAGGAHAADLAATSTVPIVSLQDTDAAGDLGGERWQYNATATAGTLSQQALSATGGVVATDYVMTRSATGAYSHAWKLGANTGLQVAMGSGLPQVLVPRGAATACGLAFIGDGNTGIFSSAANTVNISVGNYEKVRVGAPAGWSTAMTVSRSATSTDSLPASVKGMLPLWVIGADNNLSGIGADAFAGTPTVIGRRAEGTAAIPAAVAAGNVLMAVEGRGFGATAYSTTTRGGLQVVATQPWTDTAQGTYVELLTTASNAVAATAVGRVDNTGVLSWGGSRDGLATYAASTVRPMIQTTGSTTSAAAMGIARFSADSLPPALHLAKGRSNTVGTHSVVALNDQLGAITAGGADGTDMATAAQILFEADGTVAANQVPGRIRLITASATGAQVEALRITKDGNVGIGMTSPTNKLEVNGTIRAKEVIVETIGNWADHVFADGYALRPLSEVAAYIATHRHLPDIPAAATLNENGLPLSDMARLHMQKIEELTLYVLKLEADKTALEQRLAAEQVARITTAAALEARLTALEARTTK